MAAPEEVDVWVGPDAGKEFHHAIVLDDAGNALFDRRVSNAEPDIVQLLDAAAQHGTVGVSSTSLARSPSCCWRSLAAAIHLLRTCRAW